MKRNIEDDILLLNQIRKGDEVSFRILFDTYFASMCRFMHVYLYDKEVVEEQVLDIFMYIWENRTTLEIQLSLKAYLFQAARNKALNVLRQKNRPSLWMR